MFLATLNHRIIPQPAEGVFGAFVGREHGIEDVLDSPLANNHGQPLHQPHSIHFECRQSERLRRPEIRVAENLKRDVQPRAPGIMSQPVGSGSPGTPVLG
jgi:hypothetical protein